MKIALIQLNPTIGDIRGNTDAILREISRAASDGADLAVFPEQCVLGYPAKDLLLRRDVIAANVAALNEIARACSGVAAIVGFAEPNPHAHGRPVYNAAAFLQDGRVQTVVRKRLLPTYDVFDEARYFEPGGEQPLVSFGGRKLGVTICEDMWPREELLARPLYDAHPMQDQVRAGADLLINISASPYHLGKQELRRSLLSTHAAAFRRTLILVNQVGGNDELIFDGASCVVDADGVTRVQCKSFETDREIIDIDQLPTAAPRAAPRRLEKLHAALVLGLRDYVRKCGFERVVLGLSGGIDSAVVACLAATAIGAEHVRGVAMPSRFSSEHSVADARTLGQNLAIEFSIIPIEPVHAAYEKVLAETFVWRGADVTEENIQARARGAILMALSNKFGGMLLTTGNKSELAVGYCTLYGDMCGGLAVISDVPKTMIYALADHINERAGREVIPANTITKPPSAELRPNQTDQDTLPPYDVLDAILQRHEEQFQSVDEIVAAGYERATVEHMVRMIHRSEYKRQQAAPGLKVTSRAFGFGRRMPIAVGV